MSETIETGLKKALFCQAYLYANSVVIAMAMQFLLRHISIGITKHFEKLIKYLWVEARRTYCPFIKKPYIIMLLDMNIGTHFFHCF